MKQVHSFTAVIDIIGINPFVFVPEAILKALFQEAGTDKGPIPVCGTINGNAYQQTLVRYADSWRLYINTTMLKGSPKRVGETIEITIRFDASVRSIAPHPKLTEALEQHPEAKQVFEGLSPSRQKEIVRYIGRLKSPESIDRNVSRAIDFLLGKGRFVGRDKL